MRKIAAAVTGFTAIALGPIGAAHAAAANASSGPLSSITLLPACSGEFYACQSLLPANLSGDIQFSQRPSGLGALDLEQAYGIANLVGTAGFGQTVAIVDAYDDADAEADMNAYRAQYGLPGCTTADGCFQKLNQYGFASPLPPKSPSNDNWAPETSLDLDMVSAACPNCSIVLIEANSANQTDLYDAVEAAGALDPAAVSGSFSHVQNNKAAEYAQETSDDTMFAANPDTTYFFAAGDNGYRVGYPAASPYVVAVGGTTLQKTKTGWQQGVWGGTGSGCSRYEPRPNWQPPQIAPSCPGARAVNDISAVAANLAIHDSARSAFQKLLSPGDWTNVAGTSASTPFIAGVYALAGGSGAGNAGSLYAAGSSAFTDILKGSNGRCGLNARAATWPLCNAGTGWDGPSGLGTPAGAAPFQVGDCDNDGDVGDPDEPYEC